MNKKRMTLTVVALIAFGAIIALHYLPSGDYRYPLRGVHMIGGPPPPTPVTWIGDVRMPLFVLAVFYAGLFFLFGGKDAEPVPHRPINWRRIKVIGMVLAGLVVIVGLTAAIIYAHKQEATRQANLEYLKRIEATHKAYNEYEASKHRITESEIDLIDLQLGHRHWDNLYHLTGRIRNRAANNCTRNFIKLLVLLREKEGSPDIVGKQTVEIRVEVPPDQTRAINQAIYFNNSPRLRQFRVEVWRHRNPWQWRV